jgi:hypothetical protein
MTAGKHTACFRVFFGISFKLRFLRGMLELADLMAVFVRAPRPSFARVFSSDLRGIGNKIDDKCCVSISENYLDSPWEMHLDDVIDFKEKPSAFLINSSFFADSLVDVRYIFLFFNVIDFIRLFEHNGEWACILKTILSV